MGHDPGLRLPAAILEAADKVGIRALGVPEEFGGIELDAKTEVHTFALIAEEIARGDCGLADKLVQNWKISILLRNLAPKHIQAHWFKRLVAEPQLLFAHCLTEPRGASDRWLPYNVPEAAMQTRAEKRGNEWVINGRKHFISNGFDAGLYIVYANTNTKAGVLQGTSSFVVPRDAPGLTVARCNETMGGRFMNNGEIVFEDCRVPADHVLAENDAMQKASVYFRPGKIIQAAKNLGVGVAAFERTAEYVQNYVQGGRVLIKHQAVALRLADMAIAIEAVRALLGRAADAVSENAPGRRRALQHDQGVCLGGNPEGLSERDGIAWRPRRHARDGHREVVSRRRDLLAFGRDGGHLPLQDRQGAVPADGGEVRRAGGLTGPPLRQVAVSPRVRRIRRQLALIAGRFMPATVAAPPRQCFPRPVRFAHPCERSPVLSPTGAARTTRGALGSESPLSTVRIAVGDVRTCG